MELSPIRDTYIRLTFNEANIIMENFKVQGKPALLARILDLQNHTKDATLREDAKTLLWKLAKMSDADYARLCTAAADGTLLFPGNYRLTAPYLP